MSVTSFLITHPYVRLSNNVEQKRTLIIHQPTITEKEMTDKTENSSGLQPKMVISLDVNCNVKLVQGFWFTKANKALLRYI